MHASAVKIGYTKHQVTNTRSSVATADVENKRQDEWSQLLQRVALGDRQAFAAIFAHYAPLLKAFARFDTADADQSQLAEELVQEVMIKVWQKSGSFDPTKSAATTWIYTLARNARIDMLRRLNRQAAQPLDSDDYWHPVDEETPVSQLIRKRIEENIRHNLDDLPIEQSNVLHKIYLEGKTQAEVAEEMDLPLGTVKSRVRRALDKLQLMVTR